MKIRVGDTVQVTINKGDTCDSGYYRITHIYKNGDPKFIDVEPIPPEVVEKSRQMRSAFDGSVFSGFESIIHPAPLPRSYANAGEVPVHITTNLSEEQQDEIGEALLGEADEERQEGDSTSTEQTADDDDALKALLVFDKNYEYFGDEVNDACRQAYNLGKLQGEMGQRRKAAQCDCGDKPVDGLSDIQHESEWILR